VIAPIDVRDLVGRPGSSKSVSVRGTLEGLGGELARAEEPVTADLTLESVIEGILVEGSVRGLFALTCARCLSGFEQSFEIDLGELFDSVATEDSDYVIDADRSIDVEQLLRDAIGVELPFSPLCKPDCLGLCPRCGGDLNTRGCVCGWSELPSTSRRSYAGS